MLILRLVGVILVTLGILAAIAVLLEPFGMQVSGSLLQLWLLFGLCFGSGFLIYALGVVEPGARKVLSIGGAILLVLGVCSAFGIFLDKISVVIADGTLSLWLLFVVCIIVGTAMIGAAETAE